MRSPLRFRRSTSTACAAARARTWVAARASTAGRGWPGWWPMPDVAIVGGGPAGLAAAIELRRRGIGEVVVIEREHEPGGTPRHARHQGFGLRALHRPLSGPAYARRYADRARAAGAELLTETMVTGWATDGALELTGPGGRAGL